MTKKGNNIKKEYHIDKITITNVIPDKSYYVRVLSNKKENKTVPCNKIRVNNMNFYATTYIPGVTHKSKIIHNKTTYDIVDIYTQYCFNLTLLKVKITENDINDLDDLYIESNMIQDLNKINNAKILNHIFLKSTLHYTVRSKIHPQLPGILNIVIKYNDEKIDDIYEGLAVYTSSNKFIGIVSSIEETIGLINIIPAFTIKAVVRVIKNHNIKNIWATFNKNICIIDNTNIIPANHVISSINNIHIDKNGCIYKPVLNESIPFQSLLWYLPEIYNNAINVQIYNADDEKAFKTITFKAYSINNVGSVNYYHICSLVVINSSPYQELSIEFIDFLIKHNIIIEQDYMDNVFGLYLCEKINPVVSVAIFQKDKCFIDRCVEQNEMASIEFDVITSANNKAVNSLFELQMLYTRLKKISKMVKQLHKNKTVGIKLGINNSKEIDVVI